MYTVILKRGEERGLSVAQTWVFANEVSKIEGKDKQGSIAKVTTFNGDFVGYGFINHASKIIVRILTFKEEDVDRDFFFARIKAAREMREELGFEGSYRVVFGESDLLPGLVVDKYEDHLSVQFLTLGMDVRKEMIVGILKELFNPACIYERSDVAVREKEGLKETKGVLFGTLNKNLVMTENGMKMCIDIENGQKTGYFLDQRENRAAVKKYCKGKTVLDCFCNQGGFSLQAAIGGAKEVTSVDISATALDSVRQNAEMNGLKNIITLEADVFEKLRDYKKEGKKFDVVILDPPAFTKSSDTIKSAANGYRDINNLAMQILNKGGYLITCSCSQHMTYELFIKAISEAASSAGVTLRLLESRSQNSDHAPILGGSDGNYLKALYFKKL